MVCFEPERFQIIKRFYVTESIMDHVEYTGICGRLRQINCTLVFLNLINLVFDPLKTYGSYYFDLTTDVLQAYNLYDNCHFKYAVTSVTLLAMSYVFTILNLTLLLNQPLLTALKYPLNHT